MLKQEKPATELDERLTHFVEDLESIAEPMESLSATDPISIYLHPNEAINKIQDEFAQVLDKYSFTKEDFMTLANAKPEYCAVCTQHTKYF